MLFPKNKKGNAGVFNGVGGMIVAVGIAVITIAVIAIMLGAFQSDLTSGTSEYNVTQQGLLFLQNATDKFDTAGTIVGVLVLLAVLGGGAAFGVQAYRKYK